MIKAFFFLWGLVGCLIILIIKFIHFPLIGKFMWINVFKVKTNYIFFMRISLFNSDRQRIEFII